MIKGDTAYIQPNGRGRYFSAKVKQVCVSDHFIILTVGQPFGSDVMFTKVDGTNIWEGQGEDAEYTRFDGPSRIIDEETRIAGMHNDRR